MSESNKNEEKELIEEVQKEENTSETNETENVSETKEESLEEKLAQEKDKFIRLFAEFDNYKKRTIKERQDILKYSNKDVLEALLPVLDDFERGIKELEKGGNIQELEGVKLIYNKLYNSLKDKGLVLIEVKPGDEFNLDLHEAITQIPAPEENLKDKIVDIIEQGYMLHDKVIRYAKVVVGK